MRRARGTWIRPVVLGVGGLGLAAAALLGLLGGGADVLAEAPGAPQRALPAAIVSPPPRVPLRFDHGKHRGEGFACTTCHGRARTSSSAADVILPRKKACLGCHDEAKVPAGHGVPGKRDTAACKKCHTAFNANGFPEPVRWPAPRFRFSHQLHVGHGTPCLECHQGVDRARRDGVPGGLHLPRMRHCFRCHRGGTALGGDRDMAPRRRAPGARPAPRRASARCVTCHEREPGGRIRARFPEGALRPGPSLPHLAHGPTFARDHRVAARAHRGECEACHRQDQCLRCHGGVRRPASIHLGNWTLLHGREARANRQKCQSCHTRQRFCASCHRRVGLNPSSTRSPYGLPRLQRFHGDRWASSTSRGVAVNRHAVQARRNVGACASCHREADCLRCHARTRVGGLGRSPHTPGFRHSRRCRKLLRTNRRACLKCHGFDDPLMLLCR